MTEGSEEYLEKALSAAFAVAGEDAPPGGAAPSTKPAKPFTLPARIGRYPIDALVGRGGIGLVMRGKDVELGRPIAIKVLHEHLGSDAEMVRRFVEEAQVGAGLEHPGVVPVHEMGTTQDGRPYFTMKLVEGETLARKLAARKTNAEDRLGFLSMLEKICQIVAYAHARHVVHLDLKPANVLVGGFGEILVTDWGFASNLSERAAALREASTPGGRARIVGTPAYMSPEQARGDLSRIGCAADVFALGAILCEILTGAPAYDGDSASETLLAASRAWLDDAYSRLGGCGADPALISLARRCLQPEPADRPADAGVVAEEIGRFHRSLEERARALAIETAETKARALAERRHRRLVGALTAVGVAAIVIACGAWISIERDRAARLRDDDRLAAGIAERVRLLSERARVAPDPEPSLWDEPCTIARQAADLARARGLGADVQGRLDNLAAATESERAVAAGHSRTVADLTAIHERHGDQREAGLKDRDYAETFKKAGIDVEALGAERAAARIEASPVRSHLVHALDGWAHARRTMRASTRPDVAVLDRTANLADPDAWRVKVRTASAAGDVAALEALATAPEREQEPAESQVVLATTLARAGRRELAARVLAGAELRYPGDYQVHHELGMLRRDGPDADLSEAVRQFSMALALRPRSTHALVDLAQALLQKGDTAGAERHLEEARRIAPLYAPSWYYLGFIRFQQKNLPEAESLLRKSVELDPGWSMNQQVLGMVLHKAARIDEAAEAYRAVLATDPGSAEAWCELGQLLIEQGRFQEARTALQKGHDLGTARGAFWTHPSSEWLKRADWVLAAEKSLSEIGSDVSTEELEDLLPLAEPAYLLGRTVTAARIMERAMSDGKRAVPLPERFFAARCAAAVATGFGKEHVDPAQVPAWRGRALAWLRAAVDALEDLDANGPEYALALEVGEYALVDPAFEGLRTKERLSALPPAETAAWEAIWARIRKLSAASAPR